MASKLSSIIHKFKPNLKSFTDIDKIKPKLKAFTDITTCTGILIGQVIGFRLGYYSSDHMMIIANVFVTIGGGILGGCCFGLIGKIWYITLPIIMVRIHSDMKSEYNRNDIARYIRNNIAF